MGSIDPIVSLPKPVEPEVKQEPTAAPVPAETTPANEPEITE